MAGVFLSFRAGCMHDKAPAFFLQKAGDSFCPVLGHKNTAADGPGPVRRQGKARHPESAGLLQFLQDFLDADAVGDELLDG